MSAAAAALTRKIRQVLHDPILRRWLIGRGLGRYPAWDHGRRTPEYLAGAVIADEPISQTGFVDLPLGAPMHPIEIELAGSRVRLLPGGADQIFARPFDDTEALIALHRFAWLDCADDDIDPNWVGALWRAWMARFAVPDESFAWHPYSAAERLVNILRFARTHGLPGPRDLTLIVLGRHGKAIYDRLEYFGPGQTGNHLANNGRGLFLAGLILGRPDWVTVGERILSAEAERIFSPSGMLREGSSHYHMLVTRWYCEVAAAATAAGRASAGPFATIAAKARAVASHVLLPAGLPLIGDVSPDCPPARFIARIVGEPAITIDRDRLASDGWLRMDSEDWHMLCHAAPGGWAPMPGHAHQDFGAFELTHGTTRLLCDLGRRSYDPAGYQDIAAAAHNTLTIDGAECYPRNKPYYGDIFRRDVTGPDPKLSYKTSMAELTSDGFARLRGVGTWHREWRFDEAAFILRDEISGRGRHRIVRHLHTTLPVYQSADAISIGDFLVKLDGEVTLSRSHRWLAYGVAEPATSIDIVTETALPWTSTIKISRR